MSGTDFSAEFQRLRDIALVDDLRDLPDETEWVEFKNNNTNPEMIGKNCAALSNSARTRGHNFGYMVWGVTDKNHDIVGTNFEPGKTKGKGNQLLSIWLAVKLNPSIYFEFRIVDHPNGRVVLLEIQATTSVPVEFDGTSYIRIGSSTSKLSDFPERYAQLIEKIRPYTWETGAAKSFCSQKEIFQLLDHTSYYRLLRKPLPESTSEILDNLAADKIISKDVGGRWNITNLGAILFAEDLEDFPESLARKAVRVVAYKGRNKASGTKSRRDEKSGYAKSFESLVDFLNALLPQREEIGPALREAEVIFPSIAVRELVANALIHQDMTITGAGPTIAIFEDRLEITNPGQSLIETARMIDLPPRSRNEMIASLMRRMRICEEEGSGLDKVIHAIEGNHLPPLDLRQEEHATQAILFGPRSFADMTPEERVRACYQHAVIRRLDGERLRNSTLCDRLGIDRVNAAQASHVINATKDAGLIKPADPDHPRAGYVPFWAS